MTTDRFIYLPGYVEVDRAASLLAATLQLPARRVNCGVPGVTWNEQQFESGHPAYEFFCEPGAIGLIKGFTRMDVVKQIVCWTSCYQLGEYINPHRDRMGTVQLLVCLAAPPSRQNGGSLFVATQEFFLTPGDAIVFEATTLEHYTTPLVATEACPDPVRTVLVGRYFMQ